MNDSYEVLGLTAGADELEIRRRYLKLVRANSPDREPERFTAIRAAYDELRDPARRLETMILNPSTTDSLDALAADLRTRLAATALTLDALLSLADVE
jgi:hypothetical protein